MIQGYICAVVLFSIAYILALTRSGFHSLLVAFEVLFLLIIAVYAIMLATTVSENEKMSIEAAIKIFDPRTATLGPRGGCATLHWDNIAAMQGTIERENSVGYQLIMVAYRGDRQQEAALRKNVGTWATDFCQKSRIADHTLASGLQRPRLISYFTAHLSHKCARSSTYTTIRALCPAGSTADKVTEENVIQNKTKA